MNKNQFPVRNAQLPEDNHSLNDQINQLKEELEKIEYQLGLFESKLRAHVATEIILVQELTVLYKKLQKAKKEKRLQQKKRGKNYQEPTSLSLIKKTPQIILNPEEAKEKKRLYREAMLQVHPDKFSLNTEGEDLATEITTQLIDIYQNEDLATLRAFHQHIFSGNAAIPFQDLPENSSENIPDNQYLIMQKDTLIKEIANLKNRYTYKVMTEYENPDSFLAELKEYYLDRISRLKKRTRKSKSMTD